MSMLPDIDEASWQGYQQQKLQADFAQAQQSHDLQMQMDADAADLQSHVGDAQTAALPQTALPQPPAAPDLSRIGSWAVPPSPLPEPAPVLPPEPAPAPVAEPSADLEPAAPVPNAAASTQRPISAPSAPSVSGGISDWFGKALNAVQDAGGDARTFASNFSSGDTDVFGSALNAASAAGADVRQFASTVGAPPRPQTTAAPPGPGGPAASTAGVPDWLSSLIAKNAPELANDPDFIRTVAAGAKAESGWDPDRIQNGYSLGSGGGARGLFQFDMGGMGAPYRGNEQALLGQSGADLQASQIVPLYAKAYQSAPEGLTGAERASWVAAQAERPAGYTDPNSSARRNYAAAYGEIGGAGSAAGASTQELLSRTGAWTPPNQQVSQFGDKQLSADEAYAACGPAAAVRFAQMYGRNPSLREATDLAATVGWTAGGGMAGIGSEQQLMQKMGIGTKLVGGDWTAIAQEAQTGNPVTISTPGHYFFADGYDATSGAFHVGQSGLDLRGGSEWMTPAQIEGRMGKIQGALFADNPRVPASSTAESNSYDTTSTYKSALQPGSASLAQPAEPEFRVDQPLTDMSGRLTTAATGTEQASASPIDRLKGAFSDFIDSIGGSSTSAADVVGKAPLPMGLGQVSDLENVGRGAGAALDVIERQRQEGIERQTNILPQMQANVEAVRRGDWGEFVKGTFGLAQQAADPFIGGPEADVSPAVSAGLTAAGMDENSARVLGQVANVIGPVAFERYAPRAIDAATRVPGATVDSVLEAIDRARPPESAYASTFQPDRAAANTDLVAAITRYPEDVQSGLRDFVAEQTRAGRSGAEINDTLRQWVADNPIESSVADAGAAGLSSATRGAPARRFRLPTGGSSGGGGAGPAGAQVGQIPLGEEFGRTQTVAKPSEIPIREPAGGGGEGLAGAQPGQSPLEGFGPAADLSLPKYVPKEVQELVQTAHRSIFDRSAPVDDAALQSLADTAGVDVKRINQVWKPGVAEGTDDTMRAFSKAFDDSTAELGRQQEALRANPTDSKAITDVIRQLTQHQALQEALERKPPNAGAALKEMSKSTLAGQEASLTRLREMASRFKMSPEDFAQHLSTLDLSDPKVVSNVANTARKFTFWDKAGAVWYFGLLGRPLTHIRNVVGNTVVDAVRPAETAVSAALNPLAQRMLGEEGPRTRYIQEAGAQLKSVPDNFMESVRRSWGAMREGWVPGDTDIAELNREPFRDTKGQFLAFPGRGLMGEDQFYRGINEGMSKYQLAERLARQTGKQGGELADEIANRLKFPDEGMLEQMKKDAAYYTFQNKTAAAETLNRLRQEVPVLRFLMPFTNTPINVTRFIGERSPLGAAKLLSDAATSGGREALRAAGSGELSDRMSRAALGSATWAWLVKQAADGNITGPAPNTEADRDAFFRQGMQPYSFRNPITGKWTSYNALSPMSPLLSSAARVAKAVGDQSIKDPNDLLALSSVAAMAIGRSTLDQNFTQGISDFMDAFGSEQGDPERWTRKQIGGLVPGELQTLARATDDIVREPQTWQEEIAANVPGLSYAVPSKLDAFGHERRYPDSGLGAILNPFASSTPTTDPVELELKKLQDLKYDVEPGLVSGSTSVEFPNKESLPVQLTRDQQRQLQKQSGNVSYAILSGLVGTPEWDAQTNQEKADKIKKIIGDTRSAVRKGMAPDLVEKAIADEVKLLRFRAAHGEALPTPAATSVPAGAG